MVIGQLNQELFSWGCSPRYGNEQEDSVTSCKVIELLGISCYVTGIEEFVSC